MIEWLKENRKPLFFVALATAAYGLSKFPGLSDLHDYVVTVGWIVGVYGIGFVPGFAKTKGDE